MSNVIDIHYTLKALAEERPVFHTEGDFQFALAARIQHQFPHARIRAELPVVRYKGNPALSLDICVVLDEIAVAIEVKYATTTLDVAVNGERVRRVKDDLRGGKRYEFIKDIQRLEQEFTLSRLQSIFPYTKQTTGYAIFLTNVDGFWLPPGTTPLDGEPVRDRAFRLDDGRILYGVLSWHELTGQGTKAGKEQPLQLSGTYALQWQDYSPAGSHGTKLLRYLAVRVGA